MSTFTFDRSISVPGTPAEAWEVITDVPRLVSWITVLSEAQELEHLSRYTAVIADRVGMFSLRADLELTVTQLEAPERIVVHAEGEDRQIGSRLTIDATVSLAAEGSGSSLRAQGGYEITGRAATLGASQIKRKGEKVIDEFFNSLAETLQAN